ncbi:MAG: DMT family transporter [Alphaproteobacteria bacterium]
MWSILIASGAAWGVTVALVTLTLSTGYHPIGMSFWLSVIVFGMLTVIQIVRRKRLPMTRPYIVFCIVCGFLGTALPQILSFTTAVELDAGIRSAAYATIPLVTMLFAILFALEKANLKRLAGIGLGAAGMLILARPDVGVVKPEDTVWLILSLGIAVSYALETVYIAKTRPPEIDPITALWGMTAAAIMMMAPVTMTVDNGFYIASNWGIAELSLVTIAALHVGCYSTFIYMIDKAGTVFASQVAYIVAPAGVIGGIFILSEEPSLALALSIGLVLTGTVLVKPVEKLPAPLPAPVLEPDRKS